MPSPTPKTRKSSDGYDPLAHITAPPPNETEDERRIRLEVEAEAKRVSDAIDQQLQMEEKARKKSGDIVKILLLGTFAVVSVRPFANKCSCSVLLS